MKISQVIKELEKYQAKFGDVNLLFSNGDGRESWFSDFKPRVEFTKEWPMKERGYVISHSGY